MLFFIKLYQRKSNCMRQYSLRWFYLITTSLVKPSLNLAKFSPQCTGRMQKKERTTLDEIDKSTNEAEFHTFLPHEVMTPRQEERCSAVKRKRCALCHFNLSIYIEVSKQFFLFLHINFLGFTVSRGKQGNT